MKSRSCKMALFLLLMISVDYCVSKKTGKTRTRSGGGGGRRTSTGSRYPVSDSGTNNLPNDGKSSNGNYQNQKSGDSKSNNGVEQQFNRKQTSQVQQSGSTSQYNKPSAPVGWNVPGQQTNTLNRKDTSSSLSNSNPQRPPIGWNVPGQSGTSNLNYPQKNPAWNSPGSKSGATAQNPAWNSPGSKTGATPQNPAWSSPGSKTGATAQNPAWNSPGSKTGATAQNPAWNSPGSRNSAGYQSQSASRHNEGLATKETAKVQQSSPNQAQPPAPGWNVNKGQNNAPNSAQNSGWKSGYQTNAAPPSYHQNAAPPGYNGQPSWGAPPAYPGGHGYGGFGHQQPGGYGGYGGGYHPQQAYGGGGYGGGGYGGMGVGGGYGGGFGAPGGYGGGFGAPGGFGGGGFGGYAPARKSSFFSASTIGNVVAGMLVYNMASSLFSSALGTKRPYTVVNYYNQEPGKKIEEIKLPANVLTLCEGDVNKMCGQGTQAVCTSNGTVLCVATMTQPTPCDQNGNQAMCVNTTVPCADANDPLCQNSTQKDKLQAEVNVPCMTNLTLDVNLVDKDQTQPNTKYTYCVTTMAVAGPDYKDCENLKNTNDYRSVLGENYEWYLETEDGFRRNYSIYNYKRPMESNGQINMPVTVLVKCSEHAKKLCPPGALITCTTFNEVMCMAAIEDVHDCPEQSSTCFNSTIPCLSDSKEDFCLNKTEGSDSVTLEIPCFANITLNTPFPKFSLAEFNGTLPDVTVTSSYTYNFNYCVMTLALPGSDFDLCITEEGKKKREKERPKT